MWTVAGWKAFPAHIWCAAVVFAWSALSSLQSSVQNFSGLAAIRFFLGIFEAMYAGVPVYLSFFYPRDKIGFRQGLFISGSALANAYGGALGYAVRSHHYHHQPHTMDSHTNCLIGTDPLDQEQRTLMENPLPHRGSPHHADDNRCILHASRQHP